MLWLDHFLVVVVVGWANVVLAHADYGDLQLPDCFRVCNELHTLQGSRGGHLTDARQRPLAETRLC